jgi:hypothetical protein
MSAPPVRLALRSDEAQVERALDAVREALSRLRFGTIALTVHDGRVMQIEISEKQRFGT